MKCPLCPGLEFSSDEELRIHVVKSHKKEPTECIKYQCGNCGKIFVNYQTFRKHKQTCFRPSAPVASCSGEGEASEDVGDESVYEDMDTTVEGVEPEANDAEMPEVQGLMEIDQPEGHDGSADQDSESAEEKLQKAVLDLLTDIKDKCNATQTIVDQMIPGVNKVIHQLLDVIQSKVIEEANGAEAMFVCDVVQIVQDVQKFSVFDGLDSKDEITDHLVNSCGLVKPEKIVFRRQQEIRNGIPVWIDVDFGYVPRFMKQLEALLNREDVWHCVQNPRKAPEGCYHSVLDGHFYKNLPVHLKDDKALAIIAYDDGLEVCDSTREGEHNITNFYWVLGNIYPELRSTDQNCNLLACVKTTDLKRYGYDTLLEDFICCMNALSSDEGVKMTILGVITVIHALLLFWAGDYPASGSVAGMKESVCAEKPCHYCLASQAEDYLKVTDITLFRPRSKELHEQHLAEIEAYEKMNSREKAAHGYDPSVKYGVNVRSVLLKINYFDVTRCMVPDGMHIFNEGLLEFVCRLVIKEVLSKKKLTLNDINGKITEYSKYFRKDRPASIQEDHLGKKLKQSASQMYCLAVLLPFILRVENEEGDFEFSGELKFVECLICLLKIMNLVLAYELKDVDIIRLRQMVKEFHERLLELAPDITMGKLHLSHHLAEMILLFGVLRQQACFRFEAHHSFFKRMVKIMKNFINLTYSLSSRHQARQCKRMMEDNFLYDGHQYTVKREIMGMDDSYTTQLKSIFPNPQKLEELSRLDMYGTLYKKDSMVLLSESSRSPKFAIVQKLYRINETSFGFVCLKLNTVKLNRDVNAFEVTATCTKIALDATKLVFPHEIISLKSEGKWFVLPLGHRNILT